MALEELSRFLLAIVLLLAMAHMGGALCRRLRQPPVIGEILGGLFLGPTALGTLAPKWIQSVFQGGQSIQNGLNLIYQIGLLLLMFYSGMELRSTFQRGERRTSLFISVFGTIIPLFVGWLLYGLIDPTPHLGTAGNKMAFLLVFAIAIAVTSIPVISRILLDLKILDSPFGRIVLSAAVIEDILLYVILSVALSLVAAVQGDTFGLAEMIGVDGGSAASIVYYVGANAFFFLFSLKIGPRLFRLIESHKYNFLRKDNPAAFLLLVMFVLTGLAVFLGIPPMFGAFVAGMVSGRTSTAPEESRNAIKLFANAFFIPVYFALVGFKLDLIRQFDPVFFLSFFAVACAVKIASVWLGAKIAGEDGWGSWNLGMTMNARGGPGIVLASVALEAGIINENFYCSLVVLVILTSLMAGSWLIFVLKKGWPLRERATGKNPNLNLEPPICLS